MILRTSYVIVCVSGRLHYGDEDGARKKHSPSHCINT